MLKSLLCCNCDVEPRMRDIDQEIEDDLLLPGGDIEWDKSSRSFISRTVRKKRGDYVPPDIPNTVSSTLPIIEEFRFLKTLGKGTFGKVILSVHNPTRTLYALKAVPKSKLTTRKQIHQVKTELEILKKINHPFCIMLQYAFQNDTFLFYIFEFAAGGMLFYHLKEEGRFNESKARFYFGEIVLALEYLHEFKVIFRDLKPENCMLSAIGHIVLTDFGSAKRLDEGQKTATLAGTPQYMAPEVLRGEPYNHSADWWSCGILLYEMLVGKTPFHSSDRLEMYRTVLRGDFKVPYYISPRARSLLYRLIQQDPDLRLGCSDEHLRMHSAAEIKLHNFFSPTPLDIEEEQQYIAEEAERQRHQQALNRTRNKRASSSGSFIVSSEHIVRRLSSSAARLTGLQGTPCEWTWEDLAAKLVIPPFTPQLNHPTDCSYFDPIMLALPPTLLDLQTNGKDDPFHVDSFEYICRSSNDNYTILVGNNS